MARVFTLTIPMRVEVAVAVKALQFSYNKISKSIVPTKNIYKPPKLGGFFVALKHVGNM